MSADDQYAAYVYQFGYPPAQPGHLISFAKKNGVKVKFTDAKKVIKAKPDTSNYVPPSNLDGSSSPLPATIKSEEEKKEERRETAKRYSSSKLEIDQNTLKVEHKIIGRSKRASANRYAFLLNQLTSKGWQKEPALAALKQANGNVLLAEEALMNGESIKAGPDWSYSNGDNGRIRDKINRFNQSGNEESHALDGAKWITKHRNNNTSNDESQSQRNGYKRKGTEKDEFQGQSQGAASYNNGYNNNNASQSPANGVHYNGLLSFEQKQANGQSTGPQYNNYGQNDKNGAQFQGQSTGAQFNNYRQNNNKSQFEQESQGIQHNNNYDNNNQQFKGQSIGAQYNNNNKNNNKNNKQTQDPDDVNVSFERLLSGHASIKQRLQAMDNINMKLEELDISSDHGKVLLSCYTEQVLHQDYIYRDFEVRIKAIQQISDIFIYCLNRVHFQDIPTLIDQSLPETLDALYKLMDDNRARKFHEMCKQCITKILDAIIGKRNKEATIGLAGYLNEKINCENITQAHPRFFTAKQVFQSIIFGNTSKIINELFSIDINGWNNKIPEWKEGINIDSSTDLPQDRQWFNLLIAKLFDNNDDETFKDIITDCLSIMILDPNPDISLIGNDLVVFFQTFNHNFSNSLETEAKYRFKKFYIVQPKQTSTNDHHQSEPLRPLKPVENQNKYQKFKQQHNGETDYYRIKQETNVSIAAPTLPSI